MGRLALGCLAVLALAACAPPEAPGNASSAATVRAERRAFDGAPPIIPHAAIGAACISCHNEQGMQVEDLGFSPPSPHELTTGMSALSRCEQCHVYQTSDNVFAVNAFVGVRQDLRAGERLFVGAPPVMPHGTLMRENCRACHSGPAARAEILTDHPERFNCSQCHVEQKTFSTFSRDSVF